MDNISIDKRIRFGKPCIKGTRIAIEDILILIEKNCSVKDILNMYPTLKLEDVKNILEYKENEKHKRYT